MELASELTILVHGQEALASALRISVSLFGNKLDLLSEKDFEQLAQDGLSTYNLRPKLDGIEMESNVCLFDKDSRQIGVQNHVAFFAESNITIVDILFGMNLASSKREARDFLRGNAVQLNGEVVTDEKLELTKQNAKFGKYHLLKRGKKNFALLVLE